MATEKWQHSLYESTIAQQNFSKTYQSFNTMKSSDNCYEKAIKTKKTYNMLSTNIVPITLNITDIRSYYPLFRTKYKIPTTNYTTLLKRILTKNLLVIY